MSAEFGVGMCFRIYGHVFSFQCCVVTLGKELIIIRGSACYVCWMCCVRVSLVCMLRCYLWVGVVCGRFVLARRVITDFYQGSSSWDR
jgi:hypothetical protein